MKRIWIIGLILLLVACTPAAENGNNVTNENNTATNNDAAENGGVLAEVDEENSTVANSEDVTVGETAIPVDGERPGEPSSYPAPEAVEETDDEAYPVPETSTREVSVIPAYPAPEDLPEGVVVTFGQEGGFAGLQDEWTIAHDGTVTKNGAEVGSVAAADVAYLVGTIEQLGFFTQGPTYKPVEVCCDFFTYTITVNNGRETLTVQAIGGPPDTPQWLWEVILAIQEITTPLNAQ